MRKLIYLLLVFSACSQDSKPPKGLVWFTEFKYADLSYRILLYLKSKPYHLINVSIKAEEIPLDTIFVSKDSVRFLFKGFYTEYKGVFQKEKNIISGTWISEDKLRLPMDFRLANPDTVEGFHPRTTSSYQYSKPVADNDQWNVCSLTEQKIKTVLLDSLMKAIIQEKYKDVHSVLIARNGCLAFEEYFYTFKRQRFQNIQSVTKSFVSALTGIALGKGEIKSVNESLCSQLPKYKELACNEQNKNITLHNLLSMSTGLAWDEATYDYGDPRNTASIAARQRDAITYLLQLPRAPSPVFTYNSLNHTMMNHLLRKATHLENKDELINRLLEPLGMELYYLGSVENNVIGDIELRPRDMLKLGQVYLDNGRWNGKQIVPERWVKESTTPKIKTPQGFGYGYFWWTTTFNLNGRKVDSFFAWGYGGQYIFVVPELKLVAAFTGSHWGTDPKNYMMEVMQKYIVDSCE